MQFLKLLDGYKRIIALLTYVLEGIAQAAGLGDHTPIIGTVFALLKWDPAGMGIEIGPLLQVGLTIWAIVDGIRKAKAAAPAAKPSGFVRPLAMVGLAVLSLLLLSACGEDPLPLAPSAVPTPIPTPAQSVIRLTLGVQAGDGGRVEEVKQDRLYYVEAAPVCSDPLLPCPPLQTVAWGIQGASCELLLDEQAPLRAFICRDLGIATIRAASAGASGSVSVRVVK